MPVCRTERWLFGTSILCTYAAAKFLPKIPELHSGQSTLDQYALSSNERISSPWAHVWGTQNPPQVINLRLSRALRRPAPSVAPDTAQPVIPQRCHHSDVMLFGQFPFTVLPVGTGLSSAVPLSEHIFLVFIQHYLPSDFSTNDISLGSFPKSPCFSFFRCWFTFLCMIIYFPRSVFMVCHGAGTGRRCTSSFWVNECEGQTSPWNARPGSVYSACFSPLSPPFFLFISTCFLFLFNCSACVQQALESNRWINVCIFFP